jgi:hypothetical protein
LLKETSLATIPDYYGRRKLRPDLQLLAVVEAREAERLVVLDGANLSPFYTGIVGSR